MNATLEIPPGGPWFEGHFPGRPILPGVAELALALDALGRNADAPALKGIAHARLRQLVLPGDRLQLILRQSTGSAMQPDRARFDLVRDGAAVANAEFSFGVLRQLPAPPLPGHGDRVAYPAPETLIPHRLPMRFLTSISRASANALDGKALVPDDCALVRRGRASPLAAVEAAAQAAAAWEALRRQGGAHDPAPRIGYLVALRDVEFFVPDFSSGREFDVSIALEEAALPLTYYRIEAGLESEMLARGTIATYLPDQPA